MNAGVLMGDRIIIEADGPHDAVADAKQKRKATRRGKGHSKLTRISAAELEILTCGDAGAT